MDRFMADCRRFPSDSKCSLTIIGTEEEVVKTAVEHAVSVHGHAPSPEMTEQIRAMLEPASGYRNEDRPKESMPG